MKRAFLNHLPNRWRADAGGNAAIFFALSLIPILALVGIAVDTQMTLTRKNKVQAVIDSAVIFGARQMQDGASRDDVARGVDAYVTALLNQQNGRLDCAPVSITYRDETQDIDASIICSQPTTLSNVIGRTHMDFQVRSGSTYGIGKVDVAFVFDVSGSMGNSGKMDDLKAAALDAIDTLLPASYDTARLDDVRLAMTTYDTMVNAGSYFKAVTNKNATRTYTVNYDRTTRVCVSYRPNGNCRRYDDVVTPLVATTTITNRCVKERVGAEAFTDAAPAPGAWIEAAEARFNTSTETWSVETCNSIGPLPLTDSRANLKAYVNGLNDFGMTAGHMGVAWGWYLIDPKWDSVWPAASRPLPYDEPDGAKAMILMTDGAFNTHFSSGQGNSFDQAKALCDAAKAAQVVIYTVAFQAPSQGQEILQYCASSADHAFNPENGQQLKDAYQKIAKSISDLRITH
ncbi:pilus assembly protein TadG-related protein [Hyphomonas sp.]|uniref:TadE/TadG family type IV pilus assembly protein n=1 Tax=Hyphomonas sp. TaxID=87 RepID=UPI003D28F052